MFLRMESYSSRTKPLTHRKLFPVMLQFVAKLMYLLCWERFGPLDTMQIANEHAARSMFV